MTLLLLGAADAVSPAEVRAAPEAQLTDGCTQNTAGWFCPLTVALQGSGTVVSNDGLINCGNDCQESYHYDLEIPQSVSLTATAASGWRFSSWGNSPCAAVSGATCRVDMDHARAVTAIFETITYRLTVTVAGTGSGTVTGTGISCPGDCVQDFSSGTTVQLTETPGSNSTWGGWSGSCTGTATTCTVVMSTDRSVTATFNAIVKRTLRVTVTGAGKVTGPGIDCPTDCEEQYDSGTSVQLTETPGSNSTWGGWSGSCTGTATTCTVVMSTDRSVTATFNAIVKWTLKVSVTGSGKVTGPGIDCPTDCEEQYDSGTSVRLTETPGSNSTWGGWSGDCSGTAATCTVVMGADRNVGATFNGVKRTLKVSVTGSGKVTGPGIDCPTDCEEQYDSGTSVQLTAAPGAGMTTSWAGDCIGAGSNCTLTMSSDKTVSVTFAAAPATQPGNHRLTVTVSGNGKVSGSGIDCPGDCTQDYPAGTQVALRAAPASGYEHAWGGDCAGAGAAVSCSLAMTVARSASATFSREVVVQAEPGIDGGRPDPRKTILPPEVEQLIVLLDGTGKVVSSLDDRVTAGARATRRINCGSVGGAPSFDCYGEFRPGQALTLTAKPAGGYVFKRWTGACTGSEKTCRVVASDARTVTAVFEQGGTGAAVAALLKPPNLRVRWQSSVGAGSLVLKGSTSMPASARVDMRRPGGGPLATLRLKLAGGSFRQTLALRRGALRGGAKLFPGGFTVALTGRSGGLKLPLQMQTITVPAPAEGVVRKAFKSKLENGTAVTRFPTGAKKVWANFRFETQPRLNQGLTVRWYWPDGRPLGEVRKNNRPVISSYLSLETGLASGLWVAELRAGKRIVQRLSVRIG